jgi:hypothetical protein
MLKNSVDTSSSNSIEEDIDNQKNMNNGNSEQKFQSKENNQIDVTADRFPYSIVWTPIPLLT